MTVPLPPPADEAPPSADATTAEEAMREDVRGRVPDVRPQESAYAPRDVRSPHDPSRDDRHDDEDGGGEGA